MASLDKKYSGEFIFCLMGKPKLKSRVIFFIKFLVYLKHKIHF